MNSLSQHLRGSFNNTVRDPFSLVLVVAQWELTTVFSHDPGGFALHTPRIDLRLDDVSRAGSRHTLASTRRPEQCLRAPLATVLNSNLLLPHHPDPVALDRDAGSVGNTQSPSIHLLIWQR